MAFTRPLPEMKPEDVAVTLLADQHPAFKRPEMRARISEALRALQPTVEG